MITSSSSPDEVKIWALNEASNDFDDYRYARVAADAASIGQAYLRSLPIGWNLNSDQSIIRDKLNDHLRQQIFTSKKLRTYGFTGLEEIALLALGWMAITALGGAIQWGVERLLDWWYPERKG